MRPDSFSLFFFFFFFFFLLRCQCFNWFQCRCIKWIADLLHNPCQIESIQNLQTSCPVYLQLKKKKKRPRQISMVMTESKEN